MKRTAVALNWIIIALLVGACGPGIRERMLHTTFVSINAAADGFVEYDRAQQHVIVELAVSRSAGQAQLAAYRARRDAVVNAFQAAYRALAAAALISDNDPKTVNTAVTAAALLKAAIDQFRKDNQR